MNAYLIIRDKYEDFSKAYKKISNYILSNPKEVIKLTALDISKNCGVSSASVVRFAKDLGFKGLDELKISIASKNGDDDNKYNINTIISADDNVEELCDKIMLLIKSSNEDFFYQLDKNALEKAFKLIRNARNIYMLGIGASSLSAYDLFHKLKRANFNAFFYEDAHLNAEFFNYLTEEDVVIAFSYSGRTNEVIYPVKIASSKKASIIAVTRKKTNNLSKMADVLITVPNNEELTRMGAITSKYSSLIVSDLLYFGAIQKDFENIKDNLINTSILTRKLKLDDEE
ncbi:MurR/RpiR family transcriptional regulator [Brachyspira intermedia]|uniref:MurR/RpiR family transcriptional regulator n=1 Tax=Brachyspira intermedia TaxID=84377 RepID=UPI0030068275